MTSGRYSRQSFLGPDAQDRIEQAVIGVVGLGGGGSHIVQQLAHVGFQRYVLYDYDAVDESNLNRLIGATEADASVELAKLEVAERLIRGLQAHAQVTPIHKRWQDEPLPLRGCDLVFGCVDGPATRRDLEAMMRRYLIPYIDIGLDVHHAQGEVPVMAGQVALSMPGDLCLRCMGVITDVALAAEGRHYGDAGSHPQVVWANGVLASTAVGLAVDVLTDWTGRLRHPIYLEYFSNDGTVRPSPRLEYAPSACKHYLLTVVGDPTI